MSKDNGILHLVLKFEWWKKFNQEKKLLNTEKPVIIEAVQWTGENATEIAEFTRGSKRYFEVDNDMIRIETLEGIMTASLNDFIIKGVQGELYPCKPDIFEQTYEEVSDEV